MTTILIFIGGVAVGVVGTFALACCVATPVRRPRP